MYCQRWRHLIIRRAVLRKYYKENDKAGVSGSRYILYIPTGARASDSFSSKLTLECIGGSDSELIVSSVGIAQVAPLFVLAAIHHSQWGYICGNRAFEVWDEMKVS